VAGPSKGGVVASLADGIAGAAVGAMVDGLTPTIDIRVDYLRPATDLRAERRSATSGSPWGGRTSRFDTNDELVPGACGISMTDDAPADRR
jgi:hypothetical protein